MDRAQIVSGATIRAQIIRGSRAWLFPVNTQAGDDPPLRLSTILLSIDEPVMISVNRTQTETDKACAGLHWAIVCGELLPNQRLVELELAKQLRVIRQSPAGAMRTHERLSQ